jgi:hypothetical protein
MNGFDDVMLLLRLVTDPAATQARLDELQVAIQAAASKEVEADEAHAALETELKRVIAPGQCRTRVAAQRWRSLPSAFQNNGGRQVESRVRLRKAQTIAAETAAGFGTWSTKEARRTVRPPGFSFTVPGAALTSGDARP